MDLNDDFRTSRQHPSTFRRMGCQCDVDPVKPKHECGCRCPKCGEVCKECPGYGWAERPKQRFHDIVARVRVMIRATARKRGVPPSLLRLSRDEIDVLEAKWKNEDDDHFVKLYVDIGPPLKIFDIPIIPEVKG